MTDGGPGHGTALPAQSQAEYGRHVDLRAFRIVTTILALTTVVAAAAIGLFHDRLDLSRDDARHIASTLLVIGIADTLILYHWERLFSSKHRQW